MNRVFTVLLGLTVTAVISQAAPTIYGFSAISSNSPIDPFIAESQLSLSVNSYDINQVLFSFYNSGPLPCSITGIYIEDGILGLAQIQNSPGVSFDRSPGSPVNFPEGNLIGFNPDQLLWAASNAPTQPNGVNPGEYVGLVFNLSGGNTRDEIIARLNRGIGTTSDIQKDIRVGIQVQGFADGQSESFVLSGSNNPIPIAVDAPSTLVLAGIGLGSLWKMRKLWL